MTDTTEIENEHRRILYYKKYLYRARFDAPGIYYTHYANDATKLRVLLEKRIRNFSSIHGRVGAIAAGRITVDYEFLERYINWRNLNQDEIAVRMESSSCSVFSNDLSLLQELVDLGAQVSYTKAELSVNPNIMTLINPKHKYRVYLKGKTVPNEFHHSLMDFLDTHCNTLFPSKSLNKWLCRGDTTYIGWKHRTLYPSFFIEYDTESIDTLLGLFLTGYLGKTYIIEKRSV